MNVIFWLAAAVALLATVMVITRWNAVHALLYAIVSFLALAVIFFMLGAPFIAALEIIIYAGAIMVLFIFVIMMLNLGPHAIDEEKRLFTPGMLIGPGVLILLLLAETIYVLLRAPQAAMTAQTVQEMTPTDVSLALFGPYLIGVELASLMLLAGLVGAYHLARRMPFRMVTSEPQPEEAGKDA